MTKTPIQSAMVLAAGLGRRMQGYNSQIPKPMVEIAGRSLINRVLDRLDEAGIHKAVVNLHHKADMLEGHLAKRTTGPKIIYSYEKDILLETGGGVKKALPLLGADPFFVINSDSLWSDGQKNSLHTLAKKWQNDKMDVLLLLVDTNNLPSPTKGDFDMTPNGQLSRTKKTTDNYIFMGVQIINPKIFNGLEEGVFSLNKIYDQAINKGRLFGVVHSGQWHHVGSKNEVEIAEQFYSSNKK